MLRGSTRVSPPGYPVICYAGIEWVWIPKYCMFCDDRILAHDHNDLWGMIIYLRIGELGFLASLLMRSNGDAHRQEEYERDEHKKEPTPKKYFNFSSFRPQGTALFRSCAAGEWPWPALQGTLELSDLWKTIEGVPTDSIIRLQNQNITSHFPKFEAINSSIFHYPAANICSFVAV